MLKRLLFPLILATVTLPLAGLTSQRLESNFQSLEQVSTQDNVEGNMARYRPDSRRGSGRRAICG